MVRLHAPRRARSPARIRRCGSVAEMTTSVKLPAKSSDEEAAKPKLSRSQGAFKLIEEYAGGLREIIDRWRGRLH
jgi:hypothetical protein